MKNQWIPILATILLCCTYSLGAPEPAVVQGPSLWTTHVTFEPLQQLMYQPDNTAKPRRFWYTILTIVNRSGDDVEFHPKCDLMTDTFQILPAGKFVPEGVFAQIKRRHEKKYPLLQSLSQTKPQLLQGEDNAIDVAIIWSDIQAQAKEVKLYISGLSNETAVVALPDTDPQMQVYLRKTLELSFQLKGDAQWRSNSDILYKGKRWVMR
jgi:hypothetical protein